MLYAAAIEYPNYDKAVIVTGDGDFACLMEFLEDKGKLLRILTPNAKYSQLLKPFASYIVRVDQLKQSLAYNGRSNQKDRHRRSVETLGLSGPGDVKSVSITRVKVNSKNRGKRGRGRR